MIITHPHHPLYGQQVAIVRIRQGADPDLVVRLPDGSHAAIAMRLTNYVAAAGSDLPGAPMLLLDLGGLRQVVQLLERFRAEGRLPTTKEQLGSETAVRYD